MTFLLMFKNHLTKKLPDCKSLLLNELIIQNCARDLSIKRVFVIIITVKVVIHFKYVFYDIPRDNIKANKQKEK